MSKRIVVSCFYLVKPKTYRTHNLYKEWFQNLINCLTTNIVVFTDQKSKDFLNLEHEKVKYQILPFEELHYVKNYPLDFWLDQQEKDINKDRVWELSVLYNEKSFFVKKAIDLYKDIDWFVWCDLGCFREKYSLNFPSITYLDASKMTLLQLKKFKKVELASTYLFHAEKQVRIGGGIQVAKKEIWLQWISLYQHTFEEYQKKSTVNCDQGLMASISLQHKNLVHLVKAKKTSIIKDKWFYLIEYCSDKYKKPASIFSKFIKN